MPTSDATPLLKLENIQVAYGQVTAVWELSLTIHEKDFVAVVGPNGAGKTSLINVISRMAPIVQGKLFFKGQDVSRLPGFRMAGLGVVQSPEGRKLFGEMTVHENLLMGAYTCADRAETKRRLDKVHSLFPRLFERKGQLANTLSGGEQQMVSLGRALMAEPCLLLLDEPSLGLAPKIVSELFQAIRGIHEHGTTVLMVEQNVRQTLELVDYGYVIENGHLVLEGTGRDLLSNEHINRMYLGV